MASALAVQAETGSVNGRTNLTRALQGAWLPLESGLAVSAREGTPLSASDEESTMAPFSCRSIRRRQGLLRRTPSWEVIVDYSPVWCSSRDHRDGGDLAAAGSESRNGSGQTLAAEATADAVKANAGYRAVSAMPSLDNGHPVAEVTLVHRDGWKVVIERLD
jgi:hypothetical protein